MLSKEKKAELLEMQRNAKRLQEENPNRNYIMYGIPTVDPVEYFPEAPKDQAAQLKSDIYLEDENGLVERFDAESHGGLFSVDKFKIYIKGA